MINKVKKIKKKYIIIFLIFTLILITPYTYSKYISNFTRSFVISATRIGYKVQFDANTGDGTMETQAFQFGVSQKLATSKFTKDGYVFLNWNTRADGTGTSYEDGQEITEDLTDKDGETITLYAIYCLEKYVNNDDIVFDGEGGKNPYLDTGIYLFNEKNIHNDFEVSFVIKENDRSENDGYSSGEYPTIMNAMDESGEPWPGMVYRVFNEWDDQLVFNVAKYHDFSKGQHPSSPQKITIKRINGTIYLSSNDGTDEQLIDASGMQKTFNVSVGFGASLDGNMNQQRWFKGTLSNIKVVVKEPNTNVGTINFYPNYEGRHSLAQHVLPDTSYNLMENPFVREGYIFAGWNTKSDGTGDSYQDGQLIDPNTTNLVSSGGRVDLYAQWKKYKYTVVFNANNGTGDTVQQEFESAAPANLELNKFKTEDLSFAFWTTGENGSGDVYQDGESVENLGTAEGQVIQLYANYEQFSYQNAGPITFNGTTDYINTHIYLFSAKNVNKDFEISFEITDYENTRNYNTIVSSLDESGTPYPGFVFRINDSNEIADSSQHYNFEANASTPREKNEKYPLSTKNVIIRREGGILYLKLDNNAEEQMIDYKTLARSFYYPLTVGTSLDANFEPWRHFKGTISNLKITLSESSGSTGE